MTVEDGCLAVRRDLTSAQKAALRWLYNRGGDGVFNRHHVLLARGELAAVMRSTWNALAKSIPPCVVINGRRISTTEAGKFAAVTWAGKESDTVEEEWE